MVDMLRSRHVLLIVLLVAPAAGALAWPGKILQSSQNASGQQQGQPPDDREDLEELEFVASRAIQDNCLICHDETMINRQRLTSAQWNAEIDKMLSWGAPLPAESRPMLHAYLARHYSDREPLPEPRRASLASLDTLERGPEKEAASGQAPALGDAKALYDKNCANCHGPDGRGAELGPSLVQKAILSHPTAYHQVVRNGLRRMPGFEKALSKDQERAILRWLQDRRYP
jgi:ubiquinol-cytochrome c reductase cytochrome c subunit